MTAAQHRIDASTLDILARSSVSGFGIGLPAGQLDRAQYGAVNKVLELMGGKWSKKERVHLFPEHPGDLLDTVLLTGEITDKKKLFQFFETPAVLAERMAELANLKPTDDVLEPSAGRGAIAVALRRHQFRSLTMIELDLKNYSCLCGLGLGSVLDGDFLVQPFSGMRFDAIVMNPPFSRGQDIAHIEHALTLLAPAGRLVAICANGTRQVSALRPVIDAAGGSWEDLPAGTFKESSTNVSSALLSLRRAA